MKNGKSDITFKDHYKLVLLYFFSVISRFISIASLMKWLEKWGYGMSWRELIILSYSGLKGCLGILMAFLAMNPVFPKKFNDIVRLFYFLQK